MNWTIVIPTWQRAEMLCSTLGALREQTSRNFEVVVVCDGDDPSTLALSRSYAGDFPLRWLFHPENLGQAAGRNTGARSASGDFLLFLDDDVLPSPCLLTEHEREHSAAAAWPEHVVVGRILEDRKAPFRSRTDEFMQRAWERSLDASYPPEGAHELRSIGREAEQSVWFGLNCSIRRNLFEELGGFNPRLRSDEDTEFGYRLYRRGVQVRIAHNATVRHRGSKDMSEYYPRCWRLSGELDVYRARSLGQRCAQTEQLADLDNGGLVGRALANAAWKYPRAMLRVADACEQSTDVTGSRISFAAWARLRRVAEYWNSVRKTGITREEIRELAGHPGRILMFHSISKPQSPRETAYYTSPSAFRRFLDWIRSRDSQFVTPEDWLDGVLPERNLLMTFDDAYDDLYVELLPAVQELKIRPLVFAVVDCIGRTNAWDQEQGLRERSLLTLEQMREMQRFGVVFGSHSLTHPELTKLSESQLRREVAESKAKLEDLLGTAVDWFAYPYGDVDRRVRAAVLEAGYRAAVTTNGGFNRWQDPLALNRLEVDDRDSLLDFALKLATGRNYRKGIASRLARWRITRNSP